MKRQRAAAIVGVMLGAVLVPPSSADAGFFTDIPEELHDAYAEGDGDAVAALYAKNAVLVSDAFPTQLKGREAIAAAESQLFESFCNVEWDATNVVRQGKQLAIEYTLSADFCGAFPGPDGQLIAPTGVRIELELATIMRVSCGLIEYERRYANVQGLYAQLLPPE